MKIHRIPQFAKWVSSIFAFLFLSWPWPAHAADAWMDPSLSPKDRANFLISAMTHARAYTIDSSLDGKEWRNIYFTDWADGNVDEANEIGWQGPARYIRINVKQSSSGQGISMKDFEVYGNP